MLGGLLPVLEERGCSLFSLKDKRDSTLFTCACLLSPRHCQAVNSCRSGWIPWAALGKHLQPASPGTPQASTESECAHTSPSLSLSKAHVPTSNTQGSFPWGKDVAQPQTWCGFAHTTGYGLGSWISPGTGSTPVSMWKSSGVSQLL